MAPARNLGIIDRLEFVRAVDAATKGDAVAIALGISMVRHAQ
jgi:hypothetical protein